jgi:polyhydroxyalkanoate synthesis regulator phasin
MEREHHTDDEQEKRELVASLRHLLEAQLTASHEGDVLRVGQLGERANAIVEAIVQRGGIAEAESDDLCDLKKLYGELIQLTQAQQADVQSKLGQVRRMKRAVAAYGGYEKIARKLSSRLG